MIYIKDIKIDPKEFESVLHNYIETQDVKIEERLFGHFFKNMCMLVLYKLNIPDAHPLFEDICQQSMYLCFMAIKNELLDRFFVTTLDNNEPKWV